MNCKNHDDRQAIYQCDKCKEYFCQECVSVRRFSEDFTAYICKECGGKCDLLIKGQKPKAAAAVAKDPFQAKPAQSSQAQTSQAQPAPSQAAQKKEAKAPVMIGEKPRFLLRLPGIFIFPLKGRGIPVTILFGVIIFGIQYLARFSDILSLLLSFLMATYLLVFIYKTVEDSSKDSFRLESFPNMHYWTSTVKPLTITGLSLVICFLPAQAYFLIQKDFGIVFQTLVALGLFAFPAFLVQNVLSRKFRSLNPVGVVRILTHHLFSYLVMCGFITGVLCLYFYLNSDVLSLYGIWGEAGSSVLLIYILLVEARLLGIFARFYYLKHERT